MQDQGTGTGGSEEEPHGVARAAPSDPPIQHGVRAREEGGGAQQAAGRFCRSFEGLVGTCQR
jgi:hypothetical protein